MGWLALLGAEFGRQGRRVADAAPRGRRAAASGELGRTGGDGRARAVAAPSALARAVCPARNAAGLASRPGPTPLELPAPAWPSGCGGRASGVGAAGQGEPDLGLPTHPR